MEDERVKERLENIRLFRKELPPRIVYHYAIPTKLRPFYDGEEDCVLFCAEFLLEELFSSRFGEKGYVTRDLSHYEAYEDLSLESRIAMFVIVREFLARVRVHIREGVDSYNDMLIGSIQQCTEASPEKGFWFEFNEEIKIPRNVLYPCVISRFRRWHSRCWAAE